MAHLALANERALAAALVQPRGLRGHTPPPGNGPFSLRLSDPSQLQITLYPAPGKLKKP
ncbi:hypothetical protein NHJ13734_000554 [Beauveria thailandica]